MSNAGADASTRAVVVDPSARRIVRLESEPTTWTFVRIVSGATKKPLPRPADDWISTTAGDNRVTRSSSDIAAAGAAAGEAPSAAACFALDAASAAATRAAGSLGVSSATAAGSAARAGEGAACRGCGVSGAAGRDAGASTRARGASLRLDQ